MHLLTTTSILAALTATSFASAADITFGLATTTDDNSGSTTLNNGQTVLFDELTEEFTAGGITFTATGGGFVANTLGVSNSGLGVAPDNFFDVIPEISASEDDGSFGQFINLSVPLGQRLTSITLGSVGPLADGFLRDNETNQFLFTFAADANRTNSDQLVVDLTPFATRDLRIDAEAGEFTLLSASAVPEPTAALAGLALLGTTVLRRRRTS
jgi:hypothetical protein